MNTIDLKKNSKEELIIYIEKLSRDMSNVLNENLHLRRENDIQKEQIHILESEIENLKKK
jgi:polyhydroxyalkanoate synthesis regulator phasin